MTSSRALALVLLVAACGGAEGPGADPVAGDLRHVVLVSLDTLRADHVACYGHPFVQSPTLDGLAAEGVRFSGCISTASTTLSSHTSLFTGTYPHTHGVVKNGYAVHPDNEMLPELLAARGFRCAGFVGAAPLDPDVQFDQGFHHYDAEYSGNDPRGGGYQRPADEVTDAVLDWLDGREGGGAAERLFLFVHYFDVHSPYTHPEPYAGMYRADAFELDGSEEHLRDVRKSLTRIGSPGRGSKQRSEEGFAARLRDDTSDALARARALDAEYCAGITWTDFQLGRLLAGLRERGILDEALLVVTADHGETFYEHANVFNHGVSVYDTEIHVPLILRFPDRRHAGTVIDRLTSGVDVLPSVLALLGLPVPEGVEGEDFSPGLTGPLEPRAPVFAEATKPFTKPRFNEDEWPNRLKFQCVRTERHKYMFRLPDEQFRLYDLSADPGEERNLLTSGSESDRELAAALEATLRGWREGIAPERRTTMVDSEKQRAALDALGYGGGDEEDE